MQKNNNKTVHKSKEEIKPSTRTKKKENKCQSKDKRKSYHHKINKKKHIGKAKYQFKKEYTARNKEKS